MSYFKNASGQHVFFCMVVAATGAADAAATVTAKITKDGGSQGAAGGAVNNLGNGQYSLSASAADMNGDNIGFLFTASGDVPVSISITTEAGQMQVKKNQALAAFPFQMSDAFGNPLTGLSVTVTRSLDGGAFGNVNSSGAATEISGGWYFIPFLAGDTNGNSIGLNMAAPGARTRGVTIITQP